MAIGVPNKLINQHFLCDIDVFPYIMDYFNTTSDMSFAYIPLKRGYEKTFYRDENNHKTTKKYTMYFKGKDETNGFADLGIGFLDPTIENKYVKAVHINSLHKFSLDSNLFTFCEDTKNLYYVIYSDIEYKYAENNKKFVIIPAETLYSFFMMLNMKTECQIVDLITMENILKVLGDYRIITVDEKFLESFDNGSQLNIEIKREHCLETLNKTWYNSLDGGEAFTRTHYGYQYSAFNLSQGKIISFRDSVAMIGFCKKFELTDLESKEIARKCRYQEDMADDKTPNCYSANIYTDKNNEDWIIISRNKNEKEINDNFTIAEKIKKILITLYKNSARWTKRLNSKLKVFLSNIDKFIKYLKKSFIKVMNKVISVLLDDGYTSDFILKNLRFSYLFKNKLTPIPSIS